MRTKAEIEQLDRDAADEQYILDGECMDVASAGLDGVQEACMRLIGMIDHNLEEEPLPEQFNEKAMPAWWEKLHKDTFEQAFRETWEWGMGRLDVDIFGTYVKVLK